MLIGCACCTSSPHCASFLLSDTHTHLLPSSVSAVVSAGRFHCVSAASGPMRTHQRTDSVLLLTRQWRLNRDHKTNRCEITCKNSALTQPDVCLLQTSIIQSVSSKCSNQRNTKIYSYNVFNLVACRHNFQERVRKEVGERDHIVWTKRLNMTSTMNISTCVTSGMMVSWRDNNSHDSMQLTPSAAEKKTLCVHISRHQKCTFY